MGNIPVLKLRDADGNIIPVPAIQGEKGEPGDTSSVNGVTPDAEGNITLTSDNIPYGDTGQSVADVIGENAVESGTNLNGQWLKFPGGMMIQYGEYISNELGTEGTAVLPFPTAFPNRIAWVFVTLKSGSSNLIASVSTSGVSDEFAVKFVSAEDGALYSGSVGFNWFAIGL